MYWLEQRDTNIFEGRRAAKRGQEKQEMKRQFVKKKARTYEIGENVLLTIPSVDKRSPFDPPNLLGVILNKTEGLYKIGTLAGILDSQYIATKLTYAKKL